jgi:cytochrome P450
MSPLQVVEAVMGLALGTVVAVAAQRLWWSRLAAIPGPSLAALTGLYELYYDLFAGATFPWKLRELHRQYGPIVRITPHEVHIDDPSFAATHLSSAATARKLKYKPREHDFGMPNTIHSTIDDDLHRLRRKPLAPFFSKPQVAARERTVQEKVELVCRQLERIKGTTQVLDLRPLFWCFGSDVLSAYAFPIGLEYLSQDELKPAWRDMVIGGFRGFNYFKHFHVIWSLMRLVPASYVLQAMPDIKSRLEWAEANRARLKELIDASHADEELPSSAGVFGPLLASDLPPGEKSTERLWEEGEALLGAGTETLSNTLSTLFYYVLSDPLRAARLKRELQDATSKAGQSLTCKDLERLPYLNAVMSEAMRMSFGITNRLIRVVANQEVVYKDTVLPVGAAISMSPFLQHKNASLFLHPDEFIPERWLDGSCDKAHLLTFSKGSRQCLGIK